MFVSRTRRRLIAMAMAVTLALMLAPGGGSIALAQVGACDLLIGAEVGTALGGSSGDGHPSEGGCTWDATTGTGATVQVGTSITPGFTAQQLAGVLPSPTSEPVMIGGRQGLLLAFTVDVGDVLVAAVDDPAGVLTVALIGRAADLDRAAVLRLAEIALARLGGTEPPPAGTPAPPDPIAGDVPSEATAGAIVAGPVLATAVAGHTATLLPDGRVMIAGGAGATEATAAVELFDPATDTFGAAGPLAEDRYWHTATLLDDGRVLVTGGWGDGCDDSCTELYDPATGRSRPVSTDSFQPTHTATRLADGRVLIIEGNSQDGVLVWDPTTGAFSALDDLPVDQFGHTATLLPDGRVLVLGGWRSTEAYLIDPATGRNAPAGTLVERRAAHTATVLRDGRVLITGGEGEGQRAFEPRASAEIWDPVTLAFTAVGSMGEGRQSHTATLLADGRVLINGGAGKSEEFATFAGLASSEIFDPVTETFSPATPLLAPRADFTATLLEDGRVLIVGGGPAPERSPHGPGTVVVPVATTELYDPYHQTIGFAALPATLTPTADPVPLVASAGSGLPVAFAAEGACEVLGGGGEAALAPTGSAGTCIVTARQDGDATWHAAQPASRSVTIERAAQAITLAPLPSSITPVNAPVLLTATADSGLPVSFAVSGPCELSADPSAPALTPLGELGTCSVTASQEGDETFAPAEPVTAEVVVERAAQAIDLGPLPARVPFGASPLEVTAAADSGLEVDLSVEGPCAVVDGPALELQGAGTCRLTAAQAGDAGYAPADPVSTSVEVVTPLSGEAKGSAGAGLPPVYVTGGTVFQTILDPNRARIHHYGIWLEAGDTLTVAADAGPDGRLAVEVAAPVDGAEADPGAADWRSLADGWVASDAGVHLVRLVETGGATSPFRYTVTFGVTAAAPQASLPPDGAPLTGEVAIGSLAATEPPGTPVLAGTIVSGLLTPDRPAAVFAIDLVFGDELGVTVSDGLRAEIAYPGATDQWIALDGPWLAAEDGTWSVRVSPADPGPGAEPYRVSFAIPAVTGSNAP